MNRFHAYPAFVRLYWCALKEALDTFFRTGGGSALDAVLDSKYAAFQANGISLAPPAAIKTWITGRRNFLLTQLNTVSNVFNVTGNAKDNTIDENQFQMRRPGQIPADQGSPDPGLWNTGYRLGGDVGTERNVFRQLLGY